MKPQTKHRENQSNQAALLFYSCVRKLYVQRCGCRAIIGICLFISLIGIVGCSEKVSFLVEHESSWFGDGLLKISFESNESLSQLAIRTDEGVLITKQSLAGVKKAESLVRLSFGNELSIIFKTADGKLFESPLMLPAYKLSPVSFRFLFQSGNDFGSGVLTRGSETPLIFNFNPGSDSFQKLSVTVSTSELQFSFRDKEKWVQSWKFDLDGEDVKGEVVREIYLRAPRKIEPGTYEIMLKAEAHRNGSEVEYFDKAVKVTVLDTEELVKAISIENVEMPVTSRGKTLGGIRNDYIVLGGGLLNIPGLGSNQEMVLDYPLSHQSVTIQNKTHLAIPVIITALVENTKGEQLSAFDVPPNRPGPLVSVGTSLEPFETKPIVLPFYVTGKNVEPGNYVRVISLKLAGTGEEIVQKRMGLFLEKNTQLAMLVTALAAGLSFFTLAVILIKRNSLLRAFTTRQMVTTGLIAAVSIILVNIPVYFLSSVTVFLLGPLGFLVDGLLTEFVFNALLVALVFMIPRQGTCAMLIGVRFLLGGVLLGMITPVGLLLSSVSAISLETALWLSGITRRNKKNALSKVSRNVRVVFLFAVANAVISWIGFQLSIVLLRLNYAGWYVFISVLIGGFIYSIFGALAGRKLSGRFVSALS